MSYSLPVGFLLQGKSYVYKIEKVLGQGTFGITYLARTRVKLSAALGEIETELKVAVKEFFMKDINGRCDSTVTCSSSGDLYADYRRKFAREATNLSQLKHPHIVKVLELFEANNTYYYSMEYCEGGTLDALIERRHGLELQETLSYFCQIADALSFMHENRMLHLDLKPSNIMLRGNGEAVLIDFGLSKQYTASGDPESSTRVGSGTPGYAPLEQANYREGRDFPVTMDVYALGATLFKMLSGTRPPEASDLLNEGFPACELQQKGVCDELITCISTAMSPSRKDRPQSVDEFLRLLETAVVGNGYKVVKDEDNVLDATVLEQGRASDFENEHVSDSKPLRTWILLVLLVGLCIYLFWNVFVEVKLADEQDSSKTETFFSISSCDGRINGHDYVDLGLSVRWATCNVGASRPEDYGDYYAWGDTRIKSKYTTKNSLTYGMDIGNISGNNEYDVARVQWGEDWRLPTGIEFQELLDKCKWEWIAVGDYKGYRVTGANGNFIFLPAAGYRYDTSVIYQGSFGYYWSGIPYEYDRDNNFACSLYFNYDGANRDNNSRHLGLSVRPVIDLTRKQINLDSEINNDTIVTKTPFDQFKQAMTLEGLQKVNTLLDLAKKGNGYTYFPLAEYYFSEGNIPETDKWLAKSLHTVDRFEAMKFIEKKIHEGCINLHQTYEALKHDAHDQRDYLLLAEWAKLRGDTAELKEFYQKYR